jgi:hypothetical protein
MGLIHRKCDPIRFVCVKEPREFAMELRFQTGALGWPLFGPCGCSQHGQLIC